MNEEECRICFEILDVAVKRATAYPCKHDSVCKNCIEKIKTCPVCQDVLCVTLHFKWSTKERHLHTLQVNATDTPDSIQKLLHDIVPLPVAFQLIHGGRVVRYDAPFIKIPQKSIVHVVPNWRGD